MIPPNDDTLCRQESGKELSWMDRMQLKLESLCEMESARNPNALFQETSTYLENQMTTVSTNLRKFCAEFVKELLLPPFLENDDGAPIEIGDPVQQTKPTDHDVRAGQERTAPAFISPRKNVSQQESSALIDEGCAAAMIRMSKRTEDRLLENPTVIKEEEKQASALSTLSTVTEFGKYPPPVVDPMTTSSNEKDLLIPEMRVSEQGILTSAGEAEDEADQFAQWFVGEEDRKMKLEKSLSTSSLQSSHSYKRSSSYESLLDWELI